MYKEVSIKDLQFNPFEKIGSQWMLVSAGDKNAFNTMTASWGALGVMWGSPAATVYIRQSRYTKEFIDKEDKFTISFYDQKYRDALNVCGTVSGRDCDKISKSNLTPYFVDGSVAFEEAQMIMICKKMYEDLMPAKNFVDKDADNKWYSDKDYHTMYIGKIEKVLIKE